MHRNRPRKSGLGQANLSIRSLDRGHSGKGNNFQLGLIDWAYMRFQVIVNNCYIKIKVRRDGFLALQMWPHPSLDRAYWEWSIDPLGDDFVKIRTCTFHVECRANWPPTLMMHLVGPGLFSMSGLFRSSSSIKIYAADLLKESLDSHFNLSLCVLASCLSTPSKGLLGQFKNNHKNWS